MNTGSRMTKQAELEWLCSELEENSKKGNSRAVFETEEPHQVIQTEH